MSRRSSVGFGEFVLDLRTAELSHRGRPKRVRPQARKLLNLLVIRRGELVTLDEIRFALWPDEPNTDPVVIHDRIRQCVRHLRFQLGDSKQASRYIVSEMKRGYRFAAEVFLLPDDEGARDASRDASLSGTEAAPEIVAAPPPERSRSYRGFAAAIAFLALLGVGVSSRSWFHVAEDPVYGSVCVQPPPGLVSWWPMDGTAEDVVGDNNGTPMAGATFGPGFVRQAVRLDGIDDHVIVPDSPQLSFEPTQPMTIELWVFASSSSDLMHILGKRLDCAGGPIEYQLAIDFLVNPSGLSWGTEIPNSAAITNEDVPRGQWVHLAGTFDGKTFRVYVNGERKGQSPGTLESLVPPAALVIGGTANGDAFCATWRGSIDEVALYRRALTDAEVAAIAHAGRAGKCLVPRPSSE